MSYQTAMPQKPPQPKSDTATSPATSTNGQPQAASTTQPVRHGTRQSTTQPVRHGARQSTTEDGSTRIPQQKLPDMNSLTQEIAKRHTRINNLLPNNEINQQGARDCIAMVAGRDAKLNIDNYLNQSKINITNVTSWDGMSDAIKSISAEISAAVQANFLSSKTASQVQNILNAAQKSAETQKSAEVQRFLNDAKLQLEKIAAETVKNARTELDDMKNNRDGQERAKRSRGWLGIFAAIAKIILAIEYVSKLAPLLVWLI